MPDRGSEPETNRMSLFRHHVFRHHKVEHTTCLSIIYSSTFCLCTTCLIALCSSTIYLSTICLSVMCSSTICVSTIYSSTSCLSTLCLSTVWQTFPDDPLHYNKSNSLYMNDEEQRTERRRQGQNTADSLHGLRAQAGT